MPHVRPPLTSSATPPSARTLKLNPPKTATGIGLFPIEPLPSSPNAPNPQQYAAPEVVIPHVRWGPRARALNLKPPDTATGVPTAVALGVPLPSAPNRVRPQQ